MTRDEKSCDAPQDMESHLSQSDSTGPSTCTPGAWFDGSSHAAMTRPRSTPPEMTALQLCGSEDELGGSLDRHSKQRMWTRERGRLSKKRSSFFSKEFALRGVDDSKNDSRVIDSVIILDIKLSGGLDDNETFFHGDLSFTLSEVYQRPASCVNIIIMKNISMLLGGTLDPAYHITVTATHTDIATTKNKRSAYFIQNFMRESLGIGPDRGIIKFESVAEENLTTRDVSTSCLVRDQQQKPAIKQSAVYSRWRKYSKEKDQAAFKMNPGTRRPVPVVSHALNTSKFEDLTDVRSVTGSGESELATTKTVKRRNSIMSFFGI